MTCLIRRAAFWVFASICMACGKGITNSKAAITQKITRAKSDPDNRPSLNEIPARINAVHKVICDSNNVSAEEIADKRLFRR